MSERTKLFGVKIANDYNSEARVFSGLLRKRTDPIRAVVAYNSWGGDWAGVGRFRADSGATSVAVDFGWRPNPDGRRSMAGRVYSRMRGLAAQPKLLRLARRFNPDVVYSSQQHWDCGMATTVARKLNVPQVVHLHYRIGPWLRPGPLARLRACNHVVTVSDFIRDQVLAHGVPEDRVTTIRNTMPAASLAAPGGRERVRAELGIDERAVVVTIAARLAEDKGHLDTLQAFQAAAGDDVDAHLLIAGGGPYRAAIEEAVATMGVRHRVHILGFRSDVSDILGASDIFAHPSFDDPCPLALLEAAAAGLPVVAYASGGAPEIVRDGLTGLLAPAGDAGQLGAHLRTLVTSPTARASMGEEARRRLTACFDPEDAGARFSELLQRVAGESARP